MKSLLIATAWIELGAGLVLLGVPSVAVKLLLGESLEVPAALTIVRIAGGALLALGIACWNGRTGSAVAGLATAMLIYNLGVTGLLLLANLRDGLNGMLLWPGVALHSFMAAWCIHCLRKFPAMGNVATGTVMNS